MIPLLNYMYSKHSKMGLMLSMGEYGTYKQYAEYFNKGVPHQYSYEQMKLGGQQNLSAIMGINHFSVSVKNKYAIALFDKFLAKGLVPATYTVGSKKRIFRNYIYQNSSFVSKYLDFVFINGIHPEFLLTSILLPPSMVLIENEEGEDRPRYTNIVFDNPIATFDVSIYRIIELIDVGAKLLVVDVHRDSEAWLKAVCEAFLGLNEYDLNHKIIWLMSVLELTGAIDRYYEAIEVIQRENGFNMTCSDTTSASTSTDSSTSRGSI